MKRKEDLRCPLCGSRLRSLSRPGFYYCPDISCPIVQIRFDRHLRIKRIYTSGVDTLLLRKREGWASYPLNSLGQNKKG